MAKKEEKQKPTLKKNEQKWGKKLWGIGWVGLPSILLTHQERLGIDAVDVNIILHLVKHWWEAKNLPFPTKKSIAKSMRIHPSTVQRRIRNLEQVGLIQRHKQFSEANKGQRANQYDLKGLIRKANELAKEEIEEREKRQQREVDRKRPKASHSQPKKEASNG